MAVYNATGFSTKGARMNTGVFNSSTGAQDYTGRSSKIKDMEITEQEGSDRNDSM